MSWERKWPAFSLSSANTSGGLLQSLRFGAAGWGFACPPPPPPAEGCPPPLPPAGGASASASAGVGTGVGTGVEGTFGRVMLPLVIWAASLVCVYVVIVGSMGDCRIVWEMGLSSLSDCESSLGGSASDSGDAG